MQPAVPPSRLKRYVVAEYKRAVSGNSDGESAPAGSKRRSTYPYGWIAEHEGRPRDSILDGQSARPAGRSRSTLLTWKSVAARSVYEGSPNGKWRIEDL